MDTAPPTGTESSADTIPWDQQGCPPDAFEFVDVPLEDARASLDDNGNLGDALCGQYCPPPPPAAPPPGDDFILTGCTPTEELEPLPGSTGVDDGGETGGGGGSTVGGGSTGGGSTGSGGWSGTTTTTTTSDAPVELIEVRCRYWGQCM